MLDTTTHTASSGSSESQDRARVVPNRGGLVLVVADGAGGLAGGAAAAQAVVDRIERRVLQGSAVQPTEWCSLLAEIDLSIQLTPNAGETTAVVAAVNEDLIYGASVGDSGALLVQRQNTLELTASQHRKPLLGSGRAAPIPFGPVKLEGVLILATDGLLKYVRRVAIEQMVRTSDFTELSQALCEAPRYQSGALPDDVAVIACQLSASPPP